MRRLPFLLLLLVASATSADEPYLLTVPGQGWALHLNLPPLSQYQAETVDQGFRFMGSSEESGVILSVLVEESEAEDAKACRVEYWASGSQNPMIVGETVELRDLGPHPGVVYTLEGDYQGQHVKAENANIYIFHEGRCVDLHLSRFPYEEGARERLAAIAATVDVRELDRTTGEPNSP